VSYETKDKIEESNIDNNSEKIVTKSKIIIFIIKILLNL